MTKEELEKEAEEYRKEKLKEQKDKFVFELPEVYVADIKQSYLAGAEPREKQIQIDAEQIRALQKQNGELTDRVRELEAQIEKMKQCGNCENRTVGNCEHCKRKPKQKSTDTDDYWRLRR